jgi:hypothetical protein
VDADEDGGAAAVGAIAGAEVAAPVGGEDGTPDSVDDFADWEVPVAATFEVRGLLVVL